MLTDDEARRLLQRAGETVAVDPATPIAERPRRPLWPVLAAAAAVIAVGVAAAAVTTGDEKDEPGPAAPLAKEVQIPSVLGYDLDSATDSLHDLGLSVRVETEPVCNTAYVRGTVPAAGTPVAAGAEVVVRYVIPGQGFCISEEQLAVELLALADGRGDGPPLADDVEAYDTAGRTDLGTVLDQLSAAAHDFYPGVNTGGYVSPILTANMPPGCNYTGGPAIANRDHVRVAVITDMEYLVCPDFVIDVYRTDAAVDALVLRTRSEESAPEPDSEPTIGTAFRDFARGGDLPQIADEVDLYLGNAFTGFVTEASASDRRAWATCTELGEYAGRACPLSPLVVLEEHPEIEYVDTATSKCLQTYGSIPPDLRALHRTVIVPAKGSVDSCIDDFAVQLFANDNGELVAVSLLLGEP